MEPRDVADVLHRVRTGEARQQHGTTHREGGDDVVGIVVEEIDGSPSVKNVTRVKFTNSTLTDNLDGSVSVAVAVAGAGAATGDSFVTISHDPDLTAERTLKTDNQHTLTDGGANSDVTIGGVTATTSQIGHAQFDAVVPVTQAFSDAAVAGASGIIADRAHRHGMPANPVSANGAIRTIQFVVDGGGVAITTGMKGYLEVPFTCTINRATLLADQSGSIVIDVFKCTYANFDAGSTHPVSGDKITASAPPTISSATKAQDATLTGWTTAITAGDILAFNVNSITTCQRVTLSLKVTET